MTSLVLLVDGIATIPAHPRPVALARAYSRMYPTHAVALCRLGDARSLRRFERGVEVVS